MSRLANAFAAGRKALIAYVTVGYPSLEATLEAVPLLASWGCDAVELGIPFSDPMADGPTIQRASQHSLVQGTTPELCLEVAAKLRQKVEIPLLFMTYYNLLLAQGLDAFSSRCAQAGVDGLIIPDLPPEEGTELQGYARKQGVDLVYLLAPTSTQARIELVAQKSQGFIYLVSVTGITGARDRLPVELEDFVARVRKVAHQPLCVGFGISTPEQAGRVARIADGVIVGSRIIELLESEGKPYPKLEALVRSLREALGQ